MNMHKSNFHPKYVMVFSLLLALLFPAILYGASSVQDLQNRRAAIQNSMNQRRQKIEALRSKEAQTQAQLDVVQQRLNAERNDLQAATQVYQRARYELQQANRELTTVQTQFEESRTQAKERLVRIYERGNQGYMDILISARDFGDLLQRANLAKFLMDRDKTVINDLKVKQDAVAQQVKQVEEKTNEAEKAKANLALITARTTQQRNQVATQLDAVQDAKQVAESEYKKEVADSNAITAELNRRSYLASRGGGGARYSGNASISGSLPVNGRITSPFGMRMHPIFHEYRMHTGVDISAPSGTPIYAAGAGVVICASWRGGYGYCVMIDHGGGRVTLYGHMSSIGVNEGQTVSARQFIGNVGSTGNSTGPHCHFELRINGEPVNPV